MQLDSLINHQATLSLPKSRVVALHNEAISSGRVALLSCGCPSSIAAVATHAEISRQNVYISGCSDGSIAVWDRAKKALVRVQHTGVPICSVAAAPSGTFYAVGHVTGMLSFWNCKDLLAGKEAYAKSNSKAPAAVQANGIYNLTLTLLPGSPPMPAASRLWVSWLRCQPRSCTQSTARARFTRACPSYSRYSLQCGWAPCPGWWSQLIPLWLTCERCSVT